MSYTCLSLLVCFALSWPMLLGVEHLDQSIPIDADPVAAAKIAQRNIANFKRQTQLMIDAWQDACKIDRACSTANQTILAEVYSYYTNPLDCRGNTAFLQVSPPFIPEMRIDGFQASRAGYNLQGVFVKECFAHDTTVMAAGDVSFGVQNVSEEFSIVPGSGGKTVLVSASFTIGWDGQPVRLTSTYRYQFNEEGKIELWEGRYDPVMTYDALLKSKSEFCGRELAAVNLASLKSEDRIPAAAAFFGGAMLSTMACLLMNASWSRSRRTGGSDLGASLMAD